MKKGIVRKYFLSILIINFIVIIVSLFVQNLLVEDVYLHFKIDKIEESMDGLINDLRNNDLDEIKIQDEANFFINETSASIIIMDEDFNIINNNVFEDFNYMLLKGDENQYKKVLIDFLFDEAGDLKYDEFKRSLGEEVKFRGVSIEGTSYIEVIDMSFGGINYKNQKIAWGWEDIYSSKEDDIEFGQGEIVDIHFADRQEGVVSYQSEKLWQEIKKRIYKSISKDELISLVDEESEFRYTEEGSGLEVFYKIDYVKTVDGEYKFIGVLFTMERIQPVFKILNKYYVQQYILMFAIIVILGYFLSRRITIPMIKLNNFAKKIAELDFSEKLEIKSKDEVGELSQSLNQISDNLSQKINELNVKNQELKQRALLREREEQRMRMLLGSLSHEFKTPLGIISGFIQMIKDGINEKSQDYYLDVINDEVMSLNGLVLETLELSRYESGYQKLKLEPFSIMECLENVKEKFSQELYKNESILIVNGQDYMVIGDIKKIKQVLINFISNAVRYSSKSEYIFISVKEEGEEVYIYIDNSSAHIPDEELDKIWDRFYRINKSRNRQSGGSGLGLSIVKNILELHNSTFGVKNIDIGVRFYFSLKRNK